MQPWQMLRPYGSEDIPVNFTTFYLQLLSQSTTLFMDGTFKIAPRLFAQLYLIHAVYRDHVVPVLYCLLPDKSRTTYHRMFDIVRGKMAASNMQLNPQIIMSDFESGMWIFYKCIYFYMSIMIKNVCAR